MPPGLVFYNPIQLLNTLKFAGPCEGDIDYKVTDTTHFEVNKKDENKANWLLGSNNIDTTGFDLSDPNIKIGRAHV